MLPEDGIRRLVKKTKRFQHEGHEALEEKIIGLAQQKIPICGYPCLPTAKS